MNDVYYKGERVHYLRPSIRPDGSISKRVGRHPGYSTIVDHKGTIRQVRNDCLIVVSDLPAKKS